MSNLFYNRDLDAQQRDWQRGFKKNSVNITYETSPQHASQLNKLSTYTYITLDSRTGKSRENLQDNQCLQTKPPQSLATFAKINFNQRASSSSSSKQRQTNMPIEMEDNKIKNTYESLVFPTKESYLLIQQTRQPKLAEHQTQFYRQGSKLDSSRAKSNSQIVQSKNRFEQSLINGLSFTDPITNPSSYFQFKSQSTSNKQIEDYKIKVLRLQRELTQMTLEKGQFILQLASISRQNNDLKKQLNKSQQTSFDQQMPAPKSIDSNKIQIDKDLLIQIQNISQRQKEISQTKQQFIQLASAGYQKQIKRLIHQGGLLKLQNQRINVELTIAKQDLRQKQIKIQFLQKELLSFQQKQKQSAKVQNEKYNEALTTKHSLKALQAKFKAQSRELANKQDYILKYLVSRGSHQNLQALKGLTSHTRQIEDMSEVQSQLQSSSQVHSIKMLNSSQP